MGAMNHGVPPCNLSVEEIMRGDHIWKATDGMGRRTEAVAKAMAEWSSDKPWADRHPNNRAFWVSVAEAVMTLSREECAPILAKARALRPTQGEEG